MENTVSLNNAYVK